MAPAGTVVGSPHEDVAVHKPPTRLESPWRACSCLTRCFTCDETRAGPTRPSPPLQTNDKEEPQTWPLTPAAALALAGLVAACLLFVWLLVPLLKPWEGCNDSDYGSEVKAYLVAAIAMTLPSSLACAAYLRVATKADRSWQLHAHGAILFVVLVQSSLGEYGSGTSIFGCSAVVSGAVVALGGLLSLYKTPLIMLMVQKFDALVPDDRVPRRCGSCLMRTRRWGSAVAVNFLVLHFCYISAGVLMAVSASNGSSPEDLAAALRLEFPDSGSGPITPALQVGFIVTMRVAVFSIATMLITLPVFVIAVFRRTRVTLERLKERKVRASSFRRNWRTLYKHFAGASVTLITGFLPPLVPILGFVADLSIGHGSKYSSVWSTAPRVLDTLGDVLGILLLSDIWAILQRGQDDNLMVGDVAGRIKDGLQAAVLTSRADIVFEGRVSSETLRQQCIVSFPGKCVPEWNALTWLCVRGEASSACVFLPKEDPKGRFGRHVENPEKLPGQEPECWCYSLYGEKKEWGCAWFHEWRQNVEKAVELGLELIVVYFPGEIGKGKVAWDDLRTADLWRGDGLGGSQKGEVAYLMRQGYDFAEEDIDSLNHLFGSKTGLISCPTPAVQDTWHNWWFPRALRGTS